MTSDVYTHYGDDINMQASDKCIKHFNPKYL